MKSLMFTLAFLTFLMCVSLAFAQEDVFDRRHAAVGYSSNVDVHTLNVNAVIPITINPFSGGLTLGMQRAFREEETIVDEIDARATAGIEGDLLQAKGFVGLERSNQKGTDWTREVGAYIGLSPTQVGNFTVEVAAGTLFEQVQYQEILGLEDANAGRLLGIAKVGLGNFTTIAELTPTFQLEDTQLSIQSVLTYGLADNISLRLDSEFDYTAEPVGDYGNWANRWTLGADIEF